MKIVELASIAKIYNGNSINAKTKLEKYSKHINGWSYIGTKDIDYSCWINYENGIYIPFDDTAFKICPKDSILVCSEGGNAGKKTAYVNRDICFGNKLYAIVNDKNQFLSKYIFYYTRYNQFFRDFQNQLNGIIGGVSVKKFGGIKVPLPSLPEQQCIVEKIEELFSDLDSAVADLNKTKALLKTYRQAVLKYFFENIIGTCYTLEDLTTKITDGTHKTPRYVESGIKFVSAKDIINGKLIFDKCRFISPEEHTFFIKRCNPSYGDILLTKSGTIGNTAIVETREPFSLFESLALIKPAADLVSSEFLKLGINYCLVSTDLYKNIKGVAVKHLHLEDIRKAIISIPTLNEQQRIVQEIESRLSVCDKIEQTVNESLLKAENLRQSILKQAFEGKLVQ